MKKVMFIGAMLLCGMMIVSVPADAQTRKEKKESKKKDWQTKETIKDIHNQGQVHDAQVQEAQKEYNMWGIGGEAPCSDASFDDEEYFRDFGQGTSTNLQKARMAALKAAKDMILEKLAMYVEGVMSSYSSSTQGDGSGDDVIEAMQNKFDGMIRAKLNNAEKVCEKQYKNNNGAWDAYYAIQISKADLRKAMKQTILSDNELRARVNQKAFEQATEGQFEEMMKRANQEDF